MLCPVCQSPNPDAALFCTSCGSPLAPVEEASDANFLPPRTALRGGAFVIEELLGAGGFGLTYRARESALGREVAVKEFFPFGSMRHNGRVVPPPRVSSEDWAHDLGAFREEALTLARFSHPAIVRAYAVWAEGGTAYFAMEFLRGQSLQKRLDNGQPLPVDEALTIIESIGEALARVHEAGLLHRDIKPDNILLCPGRAVLIDFGTARSFAADQTTPMTQLLTPGYAPLEQYGRRARFGPFTDVYALAATLYHALSGQAPPASTDRAAGVELRPLDELNPRVSFRLARAIETALEIAVPKRPQTVGAWLDSLREAQKPLPVVPPPAPFIPAHITTGPNPTSPWVPPTTASPSAGTDWTTPIPMPPAPPPGPSSVPAPRPRSQSPATVYPHAPEIAPDARVPLWFWALVTIVPLLFLGYWFWYDPARSDLRAFDARVQPVLVLSDDVRKSFAAVDLSTPTSLNAGVQATVLPEQQKVVATLQSLKPTSDEALFSRDQLLDAENDKLGALQGMATAQSSSELNTALESLKRADNERAIWRTDYNYLMHQHRVR